MKYNILFCVIVILNAIQLLYALHKRMDLGVLSYTIPFNIKREGCKSIYGESDFTDPGWWTYHFLTAVL